MTPHLAHTPTLKTERLTLRAPCMEDFAGFEAFYLSERARFIGGPGTVRTAWRAFAHVAGMWVLKGFGLFVFTHRADDQPLGFVGPWKPEGWPEPEFGWSIWDAATEGQGYAYEAAKAARSYAYDTLGWTTAVSYIDADNARSIALAMRLGCHLDPDAAQPDSDLPPAQVYRHPGPGQIA